MATIQQLEDAVVRARAANDDASVQYLLQQIEGKKASEEVDISGYRLAEEEDSGFFENIASGFGAGAVGVGEMASLGAVTALEEEAELKAREKIQSVASSLRPEGGDPDSYAYKIAQGFGSVAGLAVPAAAAVYFGAPTLAATGIAGALGVGAASGEASERARAAGATEEERSSAVLRAAPIGLLEVLPLGRFIKAIDVPVLTDLANKIGPDVVEDLGQKVQSAFVSGGFEAAQEAASGVLQNLNEQQYNAAAETFGGVGEEATIGGIVGATLDLLLPGGSRARGVSRKDAKALIDSETENDEQRQQADEAFLLPALPETVNIPMPDGSLRENVSMDDPDAIAYVRAQKMQSRAETDLTTQRETELEAIRTAQDKEQGLASLVRDDAAEQARRQTGDLFPLEKATAEREAARVAARAPEGMSDAEMADAMAEQDAETERAKRLEDDDQIKEQPDMVARAEDEQIRDMEETAEIESMLAEDAAQEAKDAEEKRAIEQEYSILFEGNLDVADAEARDAAVATENRAALAQLEAQVKERGPKQTQQQQPLGGMQSKTAAKRQGVRRDATVTGAESVPTLPELQPVSKAVTQQLEGLGIAVPAVTTKAAPKAKAPVRGTPPTPVPVDTSTQEAAADIGGNIEFPTAIPRGTEFTQPADVEAIDALLTKKVARSGDEKIAQAYIKRFKRPADAFEAIAFEIAENTPKFRSQEGIPTSEVAKFKGTGGANTKATLRWVEKNLSPDAKAEIDRRVVEQQNKSADVEKDTKARATQEREDTRVKQRETKIAQDVDKATAGKAKVVGTSTPSKATPKAEPSPTARADKAAKKEDIVKEAVEKVQGKAKTKEPLTEDMSPAQLREKIAKDTASFVANGGIIDVLNLELDPKVAAALDANLPTAVKALLKKGDLKGALQSLAKSSKNKRVKQIARALAENTGTTKVELANTAEIQKRGYDTKGEDVAGLFDPAINTVILNSNVPLTVHALLHETTHASTINVLKNKSHPLTKQMQKLYEDSKPYLGTAYGTKNLNEFIAEVFSNPKFQQELAKINVKGEPISALERFYRAVTNYVRKLIGMETRPTGSALEAADAAIIGMLSPNITTRGGAMYMKSTPEGVKEVLRSIGATQKAINDNVSSKDFVKNAKDFVTDMSITTKVKKVFFKLTGSQALGDLARTMGFKQVGLKLHDAFESQIGDIRRADGLVQKVVDATDAWIKKPSVGMNGLNVLNSLVYSSEHGATIYQVDPTKPRSYYKGKKAAADNNIDLVDIWDAQRKDWNKLTANGGDKIFTLQRDEYGRMHKELVKAIEGQIDELVGTDSASGKKLKKQVYERMFAAGNLDVYFPLVREGNFKLFFNAKIRDADGNVLRTEPVFLMFNNKSDRNNTEAALKDDPDVVGDIEAYEGTTSRERFNNAPSGSFVADVLDVLKASKVDPKVQEEVMRLFIEALPENSFAKSLQRRKNTLGFIADTRVALKDKGFALSAQVEKIKNSAIIRSIENEIAEMKTPEGGNRETFQAMQEELIERAIFARTGAKDKPAEQYYKLANQIAFIYTIGFNASSAIVNLTQVPMFVGPMLSAKFGVKETYAAMARAGKFVAIDSKLSMDEFYDIAGEGRNLTFTVKKSLIKKIRANSTEAEAKTKIAELEKIAPLVKLAMGKGQLYNTQIADALGISDAGRRDSKNPAMRFLDNTSALSAIMFNTAERFNRQTAMIMSYNLTLDKMTADGKAGKQFYSSKQADFIDVPSDSESVAALAAEEALYLTQETNGGAVLETAPSLSQQGVGRVALMYKSHGLQMYYTMIKSAVLAADNMYGKTPKELELRNMALKQLAGVHLTALFFAGVQGIPLYGAVTMLADMFLLDDEEDDADTVVRKYVEEGWYKGAVAELTGVDIAGRVRLTGLLLQENRFNKDPSLEESIGFAIGGPALSVAGRLQRGITDLGEGEVQRGIENLLPAGITNVWRNTMGRYVQEGGIFTRRGDVIHDDLTIGDFATQALGFPPVEYTFKTEQTARNKGIEKAITERRSSLTKKFYVAQRLGDYEEMDKILTEIGKFNSRHPVEAILPETIMKSVKSHMGTTATMHNGVSISPLMRYAINISNEEYRQ
jgi:hypothetical protein